jgi:archaeal flagellar protein FlaJ
MKLPNISKKYDADKYYGKDKNILILLVISLTLSIILFFLGILIFAGVAEVAGNILTGMDFIVFGLITSIGPIGFYNYTKAKRKKLVEEQLPDFLREISSAAASGMTIFDAIITSSQGDHGRLTPELKMMASQLSWGISVEESLENFAKRINTPAIKRIVVTINKSLEIGGNTASVFEAAAKEIDQVKLVEQQRRAEMSLYAMVIFISFFVFLAVIIIINTTIFAAIYDLQGKMPAGNVAGTGLSFSNVNPEEIKNVFFIFVLVQSTGGGLLGGFMMDGKLSSGVRFAFALILISFVIFKFLF